MENQLQKEKQDGTVWNWQFRTIAVLLGLILALLLSGCVATVGLQGVSPHRTEITVAQSATISDYVPEPRHLESYEWRATLDRVLERIKPAVRSTCYSIGADHCEMVGQHVEIVADPTINAFVDSNNVVRVHSGLLRYAASDEEIAAVLAHEYGHVFANHIAKKHQNDEIGLLGVLLMSFLGEHYG